MMTLSSSGRIAPFHGVHGGSNPPGVTKTIGILQALVV